MAQFAPSPSVYVGNLDPQVNEPILFEHFRSIGPIVSVRVCLDTQTQKSLGYGYVNFQNPGDAESAIDKLGTSRLCNKYIRVAKVQRDPTMRRSGLSNIIIKHLPSNIDTPGLKTMFSKFGKIASASIAVDDKNDSRGYAYVMFEKEDSAAKAVDEMHGSDVDGKTLTVEKYRPQHRAEQLGNYTNLYIKNVSSLVDDERLKAFFSQYGIVTSAKIRMDPTNSSMGFGYVAFASHEEAATAVEGTNEQSVDIADSTGKLVVRRFQTRMERTRNRERSRREKQLQFAKFPNLYVKNFDDTVSSDRLKEMFERVGSTVSVKVMVDPTTKLSRQFGFVSVRDQNVAMKCIQELNGSTFLGPRPLFVTFALKKDARRQALEEQQKKRRAPMMPGYTGPQGMMGMGNMFSPMPTMPMARNLGAPNPMSQAMMRPPNNMMGMPRQQMDLMRRPPSNLVPRAMPLPPQPQQQPPQQSLTTLLASMNPEQQKNVLGERLYTHIIREHPQEAAKVTGMLLEMDNGEILNLLDSPDLLDSKIKEALEVLERHGGM